MKRKRCRRACVLAVMLPLCFWWICPLPAAQSSEDAASPPRTEAAVAQEANAFGRYRLTASDGRVGWVSVNRAGGLVNVDITASNAGNVGDCHFNFSVQLNGNSAEYTGTKNSACKIRLRFLGDRLELASTEACGNPRAPFENLATCEKGAALIDGSYEKIKAP